MQQAVTAQQWASQKPIDDAWPVTVPGGEGGGIATAEGLELCLCLAMQAKMCTCVALTGPFAKPAEMVGRALLLPATARV